ncbi:1-deoxy-D-xylulose-5-phosphate reductoisomerase [Martelella alba]|uniref:1-deoxy-D-xylulose 5-phosphate reductoisomerase n=1 Tax=Martelella alba TaxID=2590451 RepID=A0A506UF21_9HYPH|nr:1-deoxy-D-xylulose-5-phosphate reductoisomerase [Martelella alba]TPW31399.1 1-deoxy-D-xylulose-5-phosphate reductoisomerase [Martelella alba]
MTQRRIAIFGATGSIGINTLDVIDQLGGAERFEVTAITGHSNIDTLAASAITHRARAAVTADPERYAALKEALSGSAVTAMAGETGLMEAAAMDNDIVMAAIVGTAGLKPALAAAKAGADIALANKECLVSAGPLFMQAVADGGGRLLPVDSEHSAIFQVLEENQRKALERVIITASGGPFRTKSLAEMRNVDAATARAHPNWSMGLKISIDSASMFNKALEMIEAMHLFRLRPDQVEVIVHPQSIIHSMVGYADGSVLAQLGSPDMRTAIGYALAYPARPSLSVERLDFARLARLDFEAPDETRFPALRLARTAMERGGLQGAVLNAAKEVALEAFIAGRCGFLEMAEITGKVMNAMQALPAAASIEDIYAADAEARRRAADHLKAQAE